MRQSGSAASVSAYMTRQPLHLTVREMRTLIMHYECGLQMFHLSECVSKILLGKRLKYGAYLELKNNHHVACHV